MMTRVHDRGGVLPRPAESPGSRDQILRVMPTSALDAVRAAGITHRVIRHGPVRSLAWPVIADERMAGRQVTLGAGQHGVAIAAAADEILAVLAAELADITDPEPGHAGN